MFKFVVSLGFVVVASSVFAQATAAAPATATPAAQAEDAVAFMKRVDDKAATHTNVKGVLQLKGQGIADHMDCTFSLMKPNFVTMVTPQFEVHANGTDTMIYQPQQKMFIKMTPEMQKQGDPTVMLIGVNGMLSANPSATFQPQGKIKSGFFRGAKASIVQLTSTGMGPVTLYVNPDTLDPIAFTSPDGKNTAVYQNMVFDGPMKAEDFAWTPPADAKSMEDMMKAAAANKPAPAEENSRLLKEGAMLPDFTLKTPTGGTLTLSKSLGKKATIVNFWADFCGPCHMEMPVFVKMYKDLHDQGLEIISIDDGDDAKTILKDAKEGGFNYPLAMNGTGKSNLMEVYGCDAYPTNFILDSTGKIVAVVVGFDEDALKAGLKKAGLEVK